MPRLYKISDWRPGLPDWHFYCPGCRCDHGVWTSQDNIAKWDFNGDIEKPTFSPSILVRMQDGDITKVCHSFVRDGRIEFLGDCTHELAGKTVEMEDIR